MKARYAVETRHAATRSRSACDPLLTSSIVPGSSAHRQLLLVRRLLRPHPQACHRVLCSQRHSLHLLKVPLHDQSFNVAPPHEEPLPLPEVDLAAFGPDGAAVAHDPNGDEELLGRTLDRSAYVEDVDEWSLKLEDKVAVTTEEVDLKRRELGPCVGRVERRCWRA